MADLFGRAVAIEFGRPGRAGTRHADLDVEFTASHTASATPSKAAIKVYNFAASSLAALAERDVVVRLFAGYGAPRLIFAGSPVKGGVITARDGADRVTTIEVADGGRAYQGARVDVSFGATASWREVFAAVVDATGYASPPALPAAVDAVAFAGGVHLAGPARDVLDRLATAAGARWYVRDGALYGVAVGEGTGEPAPVFGPRTGLVGAPTTTPEGDVSIRALLDPSMRPGRPYRIESATVTGDYVARDVTFEGSTRGAAFYVVIRGKRK